MSWTSPLNSSLVSSPAMSLSVESTPADQKLTTEEAFQDFVAGTFYQQMLKSLRSTESSVQYLDGGQAEQIFRSQLDQQLAENLARDHGAAFSQSLYQSFRIQLDSQAREVQTAGSQIDQIA